MKLMFASDIHGSLPATERIVTLFEESGAQWLILLGDLLNHGPRNALPDGYAPAQVAERLNALAPKIIAVRGNCDSEVLLGEPRLFLTHGHLFHPENLPPLNERDVLVYGHTHIPVARRGDACTLFNPGSVSIPKGGFAPSYGMLSDGVLYVQTLDDCRVIAQTSITP